MKGLKSESGTPIVIKKVRRGKPAHHGGSWKVAFADFATAMMAFFLVLWLQNNATPQQKRYISGYFKDPGGALIGPGGADSAVIDLQAPRTDTVMEQSPQGAVLVDEAQLEDLAAQKDRQRLEALKDQLLDLVESSSSLAGSKDQIHVDVVPEGVRVQIFDQENRPMFAAGSAKLNPYASKILRALARVIRLVPNKVSITGHTDRIPYTGRPNYTNWELSADRANAARRELVAGGLPPEHIAKIEGLADSQLLDVEHPQSPINRRIAIIVLRKAVSDALEEDVLRQKLDDFAEKNKGGRP